MGLLQCEGAGPSPRECHVHSWPVKSIAEHSVGRLCAPAPHTWEPGRSQSSFGETGLHRQPESGQGLGCEWTEVRSTDQPPGSNTAGRTFGMLWKAELQVVPGEAAGAFSWIRIWSFSSLEGE